MTENIEKIVKKTCSVFNVSIEDIQSKRRSKHLVFARMIIANALSSCDMCSSEIAKVIKKDSSTIRHYWSIFEQEYLYNKDFRNFADKVNVVSLDIRNDFQIELEQEFNEIIG
jgi:chromosomal replication initiation ATPase DnaA